MKRFLIKIAIFFAIVAAVDFSLGWVFNYLQDNIAGGRTGAEYYACKESNEAILIMGSSRASHHYVPQVFTDSLGLDCYNLGQDGNGIILQYGRWLMISERYKPRLIIYDVNPGFDLVENDNMTYIDRLKPFCNDNQVKAYIASIFPMERFKLMSKMYRYNYKFIELLSDCKKEEGTDKNLNGYIPLYGHIRTEMIGKGQSTGSGIIEEDSTKIRFLEQLAMDCQKKGTKLVFVASPSYSKNGRNINTFRAISKISERYEIPFLYYYESDFSNNPDLFKDSHHLNNEGALLFSSEVAGKINI